jgi:hypothetical protein
MRMMRKRSARRVFRSLPAAVMLAASLLVTPAAMPRDAVAAPAEAKRSAPSDGYLDRLLHEINGRRAMVGSPPLAYAHAGANAAVGQYLADLTPMMTSMHACFHGTHNPVAPGWDYVAASGVGGEARGEVIGCPMDGYQWTPEQVAATWWESPAHFQSLYGDPDANVVACGGYGQGRRGYESVACVTFRI